MAPPPPTWNARTVAIILHDYCARYAPLPPPPCVCYTPYNISNGNIVKTANAGSPVHTAFRQDAPENAILTRSIFRRGFKLPCAPK